MSEEKKTVFGTKEWASHNLNLYTGCSHDCKYCYAKTSAVRFNRRTPDTWKEMEIRQKEFDKSNNAPKKKGTIMFPTTHDITPEVLSDTITFLKHYLQKGNQMLIVTKPHLECIDEMTSRLTDWKDQILFRFTIGSSSDEVLKFWEPGAPDFTERLVALKLAYERGYETSISCEPMLDNNVEDLIAQVNPYVTDAIWIGKMNHPKGRLKINGGTEEDLEKIEELMAQHDDARITAIYNRYRYSPKIKWKESIKKIVGIEVPTEEGLDI